MIYKASEIKCTLCNIFYTPDNFFEKDINDMKKFKLIRCKTCKEDNNFLKLNHSVFHDVLQ